MTISLNVKDAEPKKLAQDSQPCRYCMECLSPRSKLEVCRCRAPLCRDCLVGELRLTAGRGNHETHCTVCRAPYKIEVCRNARAQLTTIHATIRFAAEIVLPRRLCAMLGKSALSLQSYRHKQLTPPTSSPSSPTLEHAHPLARTPARHSPNTAPLSEVEQRVDMWQGAVYTVATFLFITGIFGMASNVFTWTEARPLLTFAIDLLTIISGVWLDELFNAPARSRNRRLFGRRVVLLVLHAWRLSDVLSIARGDGDTGLEDDYWLVKLHQLFFLHSLCLFVYFSYIFVCDISNAWRERKWKGEVTVNGKGPILLEDFR